MPRMIVPHDPERDGFLIVEKLSPNLVEVYFVPPENVRLDMDETDDHQTKLLLIDGEERHLTIYPINTFNAPSAHGRFLKPKYKKIERITLEQDIVDLDFDEMPDTSEEVREILGGLPQTFTKDYAYGLGLARPYLSIIDAVEALSDCAEIMISGEHETGKTSRGMVFNIAREDFEELRLELNKIEQHTRNAARSVKEAAAYNILAKRLGLPTKTAKSGRHPYRKLLTAVAEGKKPLSEDDQNAVLRVVSDHAKDIAERHPDKLAKLQSDIELVTLEKLIERYKEMLCQKLDESHWQAFFNQNPFILNQVFGYPAIKVQGQASVGGRKFSGSGEKITDFLVKNSLTNNAAIIEIKTPQAKLLNRTPYREGVYTPSVALSGSINQVLDQKYQFEGQIAQIKNNSRIYDIESYSVHCCLIIGRVPSDEDQLKSFEFFRGNSKDVEIVTFDELLKRLEQLYDFLRE